MLKCCYSCFFFFKQKTAYEMRISDWSSDVCSSDLVLRRIAEDGEFREDHEVGTGRGSPGPGLGDQGTVAGDIAHGRVDLGHGDPEAVRRRGGRAGGGGVHDGQS